jgi:hypothetical protein
MAHQPKPSKPHKRPTRAKGYTGFHYTTAEKKWREEHQALIDQMPPERRGRSMADFSADELAALQAKLERWDRERIGFHARMPYVPQASTELLGE